MNGDNQCCIWKLGELKKNWVARVKIVILETGNIDFFPFICNLLRPCNGMSEESLCQWFDGSKCRWRGVKSVCLIQTYCVTHYNTANIVSTHLYTKPICLKKSSKVLIWIPYLWLRFYNHTSYQADFYLCVCIQMTCFKNQWEKAASG